jgi:hypothetical protein
MHFLPQRYLLGPWFLEKRESATTPFKWRPFCWFQDGCSLKEEFWTGSATKGWQSWTKPTEKTHILAWTNTHITCYNPYMRPTCCSSCLTWIKRGESRGGRPHLGVQLHLSAKGGISCVVDVAHHAR